VSPREVFDALERLPLSVECVTISRSVGSGFLPLHNRFFADYLAALWQHREADADHYARLSTVDNERRRGAVRAAADAVEQELLRFPECPATCYLRSLMNPSHEESIEYGKKAARLCEGYRMDLLADACGYVQRQVPFGGRAVQELERRLIEERNADGRALTQAALGFIYCIAGRIDIAIARYRQCAARLGTHPGLALEIGKALVVAGRSQGAVAFLHEALGDDKSRTAACVLLAQVYRDSGDLRQSLQYANAAHNAAPAWSEVKRLRDDIAHLLKPSQAH
jgi:predicted Zn-dependent protease